MSAHISRPICDSRQYKCFLFLIFNGNFPFVILCVPSWTVHDCLALSSALLKLNRKWYASSQCQWCLLGCLLWIFFVFFLVALNKFVFWNEMLFCSVYKLLQLISSRNQTWKYCKLDYDPYDRWTWNFVIQHLSFFFQMHFELEISDQKLNEKKSVCI